MKKLLLSSICLVAASLTYAGGSCCDKGGEKTDKDTSASKNTVSSVIVAGSGSCGDKCDGKKGDSSLTERSAQLAGSTCGKSCGDKSDKSGKSGLSTAGFEFAGSSCGDKEGKKCGGEKSFSADQAFA